MTVEELIRLKGELRSLMIAVDVSLRAARNDPRSRAKESFLKVCRGRCAKAYARLFTEDSDA